MRISRTIQFKAVFLMIVFSLNTVIGFACAVGLDMGFNSHHHGEDESIVAKTSNHHKLKHHTNEEENTLHKTPNRKDDCCNGSVLKFNQLDKSVPGFVNIVNPIFVTALISAFYNIDFSLYIGKRTSNKYIARSHHPPIPDIRIAIQSFQI